jgi:hypothetical protein
MTDDVVSRAEYAPLILRRAQSARLEGWGPGRTAIALVLRDAASQLLSMRALFHPAFQRFTPLMDALNA